MNHRIVLRAAAAAAGALSLARAWAAPPECKAIPGIRGVPGR